MPVYAKEVALAPAKEINGLRAVFGEVGLSSHFSTARKSSSPQQWMYPQQLAHSADVLFRWRALHTVLAAVTTVPHNPCVCGCVGTAARGRCTLTRCAWCQWAWRWRSCWRIPLRRRTPTPPQSSAAALTWPPPAWRSLSCCCRRRASPRASAASPVRLPVAQNSLAFQTRTKWLCVGRDARAAQAAAQAPRLCTLGALHMSAGDNLNGGFCRVAGITRDAAAAATATADAFAAEIAAAEGKSGPELEAAVTAVKVRLDSAVISLVRKNALKAQLAKLQKVLADASKAAAVANKAAVVEAAKAAAAAAAEAGVKYCVVRTTVSDAAAVREAVVAVQKADNVAIALFSVDEAKDKLMLYTAVPPSVTLGTPRAPSFAPLCAGEAMLNSYRTRALNRGLGAVSDGVAWMKAGMEAVSGKGGGGKGGLAQGQGQGVAQLHTCQAAAEAFAKMALA